MNLQVVYASDDNYAPYMGISMYSLLVNNNAHFDRIHVHVLDNGIGKKNRSRLNKQISKFSSAEISFHDISQKINEIKPKHETGWSASIFGRYFIDGIAEEGADRLLYLDCDTIVNNPLNELIAVDIEGYVAAGVPDGWEARQKEYLGLSDEYIYANSGVLLINLKKWKSDDVQNKLIEFTNSFERKLIFPDQDTFNAVCGKSLLRLPLKYNFFQKMDISYIDAYVAKSEHSFTVDEVREAMENNYAGTVIFHFTGEKPWNKSESSKSFEKIFRSYARKSCWSYVKPKFRSASAAFKYYFVKAEIGAFDLAHKIVGNRFYNKMKQRFKGSEEK